MQSLDRDRQQFICNDLQQVPDTPGQTMRTDGEPSDFFYQLDDPAFLAERARVRSRLEHVPENSVGRPRLERLYEAMTEEFCRRARIAWSAARLAALPALPAFTALLAEDDVERGRKPIRRDPDPQAS